MAKSDNEAKMPHSERHLSPSSVLQPAHGIHLASARSVCWTLCSCNQPGLASCLLGVLDSLPRDKGTEGRVQFSEKPGSQENATAPQAAKMDEERWFCCLIDDSWSYPFWALWSLRSTTTGNVSGFKRSQAACCHWWHCKMTHLQNGKNMRKTHQMYSNMIFYWIVFRLSRLVDFPCGTRPQRPSGRGGKFQADKPLSCHYAQVEVEGVERAKIAKELWPFDALTQLDPLSNQLWVF